MMIVPFSLTTVETIFLGQTRRFNRIPPSPFRSFRSNIFSVIIFIVLTDVVRNFTTVLVQPKDTAFVFYVKEMVNRLRHLNVHKVQTEFVTGVYIKT